MRLAAAAFLTVASLPALARAEKPPTERWLPLVKGAVYHYAGKFSDAPFDSRVQVKEPAEGKPPGAASLGEIGRPRDRHWLVAESRPLFTVVWETDDGIYTALGYVPTGGKSEPQARVVALPPKVGARAEGSGLGFDKETQESKMAFTVVGFEDLDVPAGRYPQCLKLRYQTGAVDGNVWFARGTGLVKWANQFGHAELVSYAPSPVASKSAVDALASRCKARDTDACLEVGAALQSGVFLYTGERLDKDPARALALMGPACNKGDRRVCTALGTYYFLDVNGNPRQASKWFKRACQLGDAESCEYLPERARARRREKLGPKAPGMIGVLKPVDGETGRIFERDAQ